MAYNTDSIVDDSTAIVVDLARTSSGHDLNADTQAIVGVSGEYAGVTFVVKGRVSRSADAVGYPLVGINQATGAVVSGTITPGTDGTKSYLFPVAGYTNLVIEPTGFSTGEAIVEVDTGRFIDDVALLAAVTQDALAAGQVTQNKIDWAGLKFLAVAGANASVTPVSTACVGTVVGDRVIALFGHTTANTGTHAFLIPLIGTDFESTISIVDKIQQLASNLSANSYIAVIAPAVS